MIVFEREENLRQRTFAASRGPVDEFLYQKIFAPELLDPTTADLSDGINFYQPNSPEELQSMMMEWETMDVLNALSELSATASEGE